MTFRPRPKFNPYDWHPRFAWLPVRLDGGVWIWLGTYERRQITPKAEGVAGDCFEYREVDNAYCY